MAGASSINSCLLAGTSALCTLRGTHGTEVDQLNFRSDPAPVVACHFHLLLRTETHAAGAIGRDRRSARTLGVHSLKLRGLATEILMLAMVKTR